MIFTKKAPRSTKDTKLDVDDASLCVLCVLFFSFVVKKSRFCSGYEKIRDDSCFIRYPINARVNHAHRAHDHARSPQQ